METPTAPRLTATGFLRTVRIVLEKIGTSSLLAIHWQPTTLPRACQNCLAKITPRARVCKKLFSEFFRAMLAPCSDAHLALAQEPVTTRARRAPRDRAADVFAKSPYRKLDNDRRAVRLPCTDATERRRARLARPFGSDRRGVARAFPAGRGRYAFVQKKHRQESDPGGRGKESPRGPHMLYFGSYRVRQRHGLDGWCSEGV